MPAAFQTHAWTASGERVPAEATQSVHAWTTHAATSTAGPRPCADWGGETRGLPHFMQNCSCGTGGSESRHIIVTAQSKRLTCCASQQASGQLPAAWAHFILTQTTVFTLPR